MTQVKSYFLTLVLPSLRIGRDARLLCMARRVSLDRGYLEVTLLCGGQEQDGGQGEAEGDPAHAEAGRELSTRDSLSAAVSFWTVM